ncbi:Arm DNA-binding domain-containing protein [Roseateles sp. P5_E7]
MPQHLIPSNATIKAIKPGDPRPRLGDGAGLYLLLFVKGGSHGWRFDYSFDGKRKTLMPAARPAAPGCRKPQPSRLRKRPSSSP